MDKLVEGFKYLRVANRAEVTKEVTKSAFLEVYTILKSELLQDPLVQHTKESRQWVERMLDYNVPGGKLNRGLSVVDSYVLLKEGRDLTEEQLILATVLGWCVEWAQAAALVLDDIMDSSEMRRGNLCWYRKPEVCMIAVNDGIVLRNHVQRILKIHFGKKPYFVDLLGLFTEVEYLTTAGQMIDLITTREGKKDLSKFTPEHYDHIVKYKTSFYSFYLPVACALLMAGENLEHHNSIKDILVEMGTYFQAQDDYLDCFGEPQQIGKVGTDIEEFKCSWLLVKALERCNEEHKKVLYEHYGKEDPADVARVKALYNELDIKGAFAEYETRTHKELEISIDAHPNKRVQAILKSFLAKIYKRQK